MWQGADRAGASESPVSKLCLPPDPRLPVVGDVGDGDLHAGVKAGGGPQLAPTVERGGAARVVGPGDAGEDGATLRPAAQPDTVGREPAQSAMLISSLNPPQRLTGYAHCASPLQCSAVRKTGNAAPCPAWPAAGRSRPAAGIEKVVNESISSCLRIKR